MSNVRIQIAQAATLSVVAAVPLGLQAFVLPVDCTPQAFRGTFLVPTQHGTALQSTQVVSAGLQTIAPLAGMGAMPRTVTSVEDQWLRRAVVRSSKLVAQGKLVNRAA